MMIKGRIIKRTITNLKISEAKMEGRNRQSLIITGDFNALLSQKLIEQVDKKLGRL